MATGNKPAVDFQITGVHAALKSGGKGVADKLLAALKAALLKSADVIKAKTESVRSGKASAATLSEKVSGDVAEFAKVHLHVAVHGVSKVKSAEDVRGITDALARALDSTIRQVAGVLGGAPMTAVKRLR